MQTLKEQIFEAILEEFGFHSNEDIVRIADFLIHQGIKEVSEATIEQIKDYHAEPSEEDMFNWIHSGGDERPFDIKNSPSVEEMGNVLILEDGTCIFWYEIEVDKEPYNNHEDVER